MELSVPPEGAYRWQIPGTRQHFWCMMGAGLAQIVTSFVGVILELGQPRTASGTFLVLCWVVLAMSGSVLAALSLLDFRRRQDSTPRTVGGGKIGTVEASVKGLP